jgi:flagellar capping protein FliD
MFGVSARNRIADTQALAVERQRTAFLTTQSAQLEAQCRALTNRVADLEAKLQMCEQFVQDSGMALEDVHEMYAPRVRGDVSANS